MKKLILLIQVAFLFLALTDIYSQWYPQKRKPTSQIQFQLTIGGANNEFASSVIQTSDGGYAVAGYSNSFGAGWSDMYVVKIDAAGSIQWTRTIAIGGAANEYARSIIQTTDGGYVITGYDSIGVGIDDIFIVKLDPAGTVEWTKTVGGDGDERAYSMVLNADGGYTLAGYSSESGSYAVFIVKLDAAGEHLWSKKIGDGIATCIIQTSDGGYAFSGYTFTAITNSLDYYIVKLDSDGNPQWSTTVGGTAHDYAWSIIQTADGGYAATGYCGGFGAGASDMYVVKLNSGGSVQWTRTIGGTGWDGGWSIIQTTDGGYTVAGQTTSFGVGGGRDVYIVKLSASGTLQWSKTAGGTNQDIANSIIQTSDGGYVIAGTSYTMSGGWYALAEMYIVKIDANWKTCGNFRSRKSKSGTSGTIGYETPSVTSPVSTVTTSVPIISSGGTVTMICSRGNGPMAKFEENIQQPLHFKLEKNYPNPFNPTTNIRYNIPHASHTKLVIYDAIGREIKVLVNEVVKEGSYIVSWNGADYPSGVYFYKLTSGDFVAIKKMVLLK